MKLVFQKVKSLKNSEAIYRINNDKLTRKNSANTKKFSYQTHLNWLKKNLENKSEFITLIIFKKKIVGLIREKKFYNRPYLSWALDKKYRGKKIGKYMLRKYVNKNKKKYMAKIRRNNLPSIKICEYAGFKKFRENLKFIYFMF